MALHRRDHRLSQTQPRASHWAKIAIAMHPIAPSLRHTLQVSACAKGAVAPLQDRHIERLGRIERLERLIEQLGRRSIDRIARLGALYCDDEGFAARFGADGLHRRSSWPPSRRLRGGGMQGQKGGAIWRNSMSNAKSQGFSTARLAHIDRFIQDKYIATGRMPCAQVLVARKGERVHQSVLGLRDVERAAPLTEDTVFRIYSMTKPVTSVALMSLVEEGLIALDDPVARHIPAWKDLGVFSAGLGPYLTTPPARPMQVVDLMRHTSGLTYGFQSRTNVDAAYRKLRVADHHGDTDLDGMIEALAKLPLEFS